MEFAHGPESTQLRGLQGSSSIGGGRGARGGTGNLCISDLKWLCLDSLEQTWSESGATLAGSSGPHQGVRNRKWEPNTEPVWKTVYPPLAPRD